jgi:hypothetical protein
MNSPLPANGARAEGGFFIGAAAQTVQKGSRLRCKMAEKRAKETWPARRASFL